MEESRNAKPKRLAAALTLAAAFLFAGISHAAADSTILAIPPAIHPDCSQAEASHFASLWTRDDAAHLLRRAGFSGTPQQINKLHALGKEQAVDYLITGSLPSGVAAVDAPFLPVNLKPLEFTPQPDEKPGKAAKIGAIELQTQWLLRMIHTDRPLQEKMTLFWHGLFTSGIREVKNADQMLAQNQLFHEQAIGNYRALTLSILHDPAMLKYLNNNENVKGKPNENLARELCELFTMGQGNGYTEKDVGQIARALTGATVSGGKKGRGGYRFDPSVHDNGLKTIFGKNGNYKPDDVVDLIFQQPQPAEHLARRLWEFFAYPDPSEKELAPVVAALDDHHYDVGPALRALFLSPDFYSQRAKFALIKSPPELLVSTIRMLDLPFDSPQEQRAAALAVSSMGQTLLEPPNVSGWPGGENWITAATLFCRYNTTTALVDDNLRPEQKSKPGKPEDAKRKNRNAPLGTNAASPQKLFPDLPPNPTPRQVVDAAVARFLQRPLHPDKCKILADSMGEQPLHLGQPASDSRIREMLGLLLSTPEYQVE